MTLTFAHLRDVNVRRQGPDGWNQPIGDWSFDDWFIAVGGELGEALNVVKKLNRARDGLTGNTRTPDELKADLADELADAVLYLDLLMASLGQMISVQIGVTSFTDLRNYTGMYPTEASPSHLARRALRELAYVDETGLNAGVVLRRIDDLADAFGIDLGAAVVGKFNRTSEKLGMPHRLAA